jgi:signal transduction histidine kinase/CheY-like chemotaxis protein/streptogramin lyase/AraC-like DNA-binding protein
MLTGSVEALEPASHTEGLQEFLPEPVVLGTKEGAPTGGIVDVVQDRQGFLWFACINCGLLRYDGYTFRAYTHDPADPGSISSNEVRLLHVDRTGALWVSTGDGLNRYDRDVDRFTRVGAGTGKSALGSQSVTGVVVDRTGTLWVGTDAGLDRLDPGTKVFRHYDNQPSVANKYAANFFRRAYEDPSGQLWFGTRGGGLLRYRADSDSLERFMWDGTPQDFRPQSVFSMHMDRDGKLWVAGDDSLLRLDVATLRFEVFAHQDSEVHKSFGLQSNVGFRGVDEDSSGHIWVANYDHGLARWDPQARRFVTWPPSAMRPARAPTATWQVFQDASGTIWMVGGGMGIAKFLSASEAFQPIGPPPSPPAGTNRINSVTSDTAGNVYVASMFGAHVLNLTTGQWRTLRPAGATETTAVYADPHGEIWVAAGYNERLQHLLRLSATGEVIRAYEIPGQVHSLHMDARGKLWAALPLGGVIRLDPQSGQIENFRPDPKDPTSLSHISAWRVFEDHDGQIWISTYKGLDRFIPETGKFKVYLNNPNDPSSLSGNTARGLCEDPRGRLWITTSGGLDRYVQETDSFVRYNPGNSAIDNDLGLTEVCHFDEAGHLWVKQEAGLLRFDPGSGRFESILILDGDPTAVDMVSFQDKLIVSTVHSGLMRFSPERVRHRQGPPPVALTQLLLKDQVVNPVQGSDPGIIRKSIWSMPGVTLRYDQYPVTFEFAALDFGDPLRNRYAYRLDGVDKDWIPSSAKIRQATYTTLAPGHYTFRVKAANKEGFWNKDGPVIRVTVLPPWWQTWWAYVAYSLSGLLLLSMLMHWRTALLRERARELERIVDERTRSMSEQAALIQRQAAHLEELVNLKDRLMTRISHEFRTPLTVILGPLDRLRAGVSDLSVRNYLESTKRNASRLLRLVDQLLGLARLSAGHSEPTGPVDAAPLVRHVLVSFESLAAERDVVLVAGTMQDVLVQATTDAVEKITVNLVSNAIKFTPPGGRIVVDLVVQGAAGCLSVTDTGVGIAADQIDRIFLPFERGDAEAERVAGSGLGLAFVRELVTAHAGRVEVDSVPGRGSTFRVIWPLAVARTTTKQSRTEARAGSEEARLAVAALSESPSPNIGESAKSPQEATLLLIEDNRDMQRYLVEMLGSEYRCLVAGDGSTGLASAAEEIPDLIVCDILLPGMSGYEVCHELKCSERTCHIPVILLTALESRDNRIRGFLEKADDYLTKPFDEVELRQRIANLLEIRALLRERFARDIRFDKVPLADLSPRDRGFLDRLSRLVARHHPEPDLDVKRLADALGMSDRQLQRKLKALVSLGPSEYLRAYRLQMALDRLRAGERVGAVAMAVGFSSQAYFSTCFRARFGYPPSEAGPAGQT